MTDSARSLRRCEDHSGICRDVNRNRKDIALLFKKTASIGARLNVILGTVIVILVGVVTTLLIALAQK